MTITNPEVEQYCTSHSTPEGQLLQTLIEDTQHNMAGAQMLSGRLTGRLLQTLVKISNTQRILEIGTYTGFSALMMAQALPSQGRLLTLEKNAEAVKFAQKYFNRSEHQHKITLLQCDAMSQLDTLSAAKQQFDFVFVDADKQRYPDYFDKTLTLVTTGGLIVFDNALWKGEVLAPTQQSALAIHALNQAILQNARVENVLLPIRDGVNVVRKLH